jgi:hypothetical protein
MLGGGMTPADEESLEAHVADCRDCQARLERLTRNELSLHSETAPSGDQSNSATTSSSLLKRIAQSAKAPGLCIAAAPSPERAAATPSPSPRMTSEPSKPSHTSWPTKTTVIQSTRDFVRRQYWTWPLIAALLLGIAGWRVNRSIEEAMRDRRVNELTTILNADIAALNTWMNSSRSAAELLAEDPVIRSQVETIVADPESPGRPFHALSPGAPARERVKTKGGMLERLFALISPTGWPGSDSQATC